MCGVCWGSWGFPARSLKSAPWNGIKARSAPGSGALGPRLKKSPTRRPPDHLCLTNLDCPNDPRGCAPGRRWDKPPSSSSISTGNTCPVIAGLTRLNCVFRFHDGSIKKEQIVEFLKGAQSPFQATAVDRVGRFASAPIESRSRLSRWHGGTPSGCLPAAVCAWTSIRSSICGHGFSQAPRTGQRLPQHPERVGRDGAQQTQVRPAAILRDRCVLDAGGVGNLVSC